MQFCVCAGPGRRQGAEGRCPSARRDSPAEPKSKAGAGASQQWRVSVQDVDTPRRTKLYGCTIRQVTAISILRRKNVQRSTALTARRPNRTPRPPPHAAPTARRANRTPRQAHAAPTAARRRPSRTPRQAHAAPTARCAERHRERHRQLNRKQNRATASQPLPAIAKDRSCHGLQIPRAAKYFHWNANV